MKLVHTVSELTSPTYVQLYTGTALLRLKRTCRSRGGRAVTEIPPKLFSFGDPKMKGAHREPKPKRIKKEFQGFSLMQGIRITAEGKRCWISLIMKAKKTAPAHPAAMCAIKTHLQRCAKNPVCLIFSAAINAVTRKAKLPEYWPARGTSDGQGKKPGRRLIIWSERAC